MNPFRLRRRKDDLAEELNAHLRMAVADRISRGESPEFARANALREFGSMPLVADVTRERWGWLRAERLPAGPSLRPPLAGPRPLPPPSSPSSSSPSASALTFVVFSVVNTLLLRPLPSPQSSNLSGSPATTAPSVSQTLPIVSIGSRPISAITSLFRMSAASSPISTSAKPSS